jgi:hypothetical protein
MIRQIADANAAVSKVRVGAPPRRWTVGKAILGIAAVSLSAWIGIIGALLACFGS